MGAAELAPWVRKSVAGEFINFSREPEFHPKPHVFFFGPVPKKHIISQDNSSHAYVNWI